MKPKDTSLVLSLALGCLVALSGCLTVVEENGICGTSTLNGSLAFPVRAGMAFRDPQAGKWVVWMWDVFDAGVGNDNSSFAEDWVSWCGAIADAGYNSGERLPQRLLLLSLTPPLSGAHGQPSDGGLLPMTASFYEQGQSGGLAASSASFDVTTTAECVTGPLLLTFNPDGGPSVMTGTISVPICGPTS